MGTRKKGAANRRAQLLGFRNDYQRRQASETAQRRALEAAGDTAGIKRHDAAVEKNAERQIAAGDAITSTASQEQTSTTDAGVLRSAINRASTADRHLTAKVQMLAEPHGTDLEAPKKTFRLVDLALWQAVGYRLITVDLWTHGGYAAELFKADLGTYGGVRPAFMHHVSEVMRRNKYPWRPIAVLKVNLKAFD